MLNESNDEDDVLILNSALAHDFHAKARTSDVQKSSDPSFNRFSHLNLSSLTEKGLTDCGFTHLSPIQQKSIPIARFGVDMIIQAKAGTGKTCVFVIATLEALILSCKLPQVLVMVPSREIAIQIQSVFARIGKHFKGLRASYFVGGLVREKVSAMIKTTQIVIGTPGKIRNLMSDHSMPLQHVSMLILDEADVLMESPSHVSNINWIFSSLKGSKQVLCTSATFSEELIKKLNRYLPEPTIVRLNSDCAPLEGVKLFVKALPRAEFGCELDVQNKVRTLHHILTKVVYDQVIIFSLSIKETVLLSDEMNKMGLHCDFLHSSLSQSSRRQVWKRFSSGKFKILFTTDLCSRGLDFEKVNMVINIGVPYNKQTFLHRIGRCGRFGSKAVCISFLSKRCLSIFFFLWKEYGLKLAQIHNLNEIPMDLIGNDEFWRIKFKEFDPIKFFRVYDFVNKLSIYNSPLRSSDYEILNRELVSYDFENNEFSSALSDITSEKSNIEMENDNSSCFKSDKNFQKKNKFKSKNENPYLSNQMSFEDILGLHSKLSKSKDTKLSNNLHQRKDEKSLLALIENSSWLNSFMLSLFRSSFERVKVLPLPSTSDFIPHSPVFGLEEAKQVNTTSKVSLPTELLMDKMQRRIERNDFGSVKPYATCKAPKMQPDLIGVWANEIILTALKEYSQNYEIQSSAVLESNLNDAEKPLVPSVSMMENNTRPCSYLKEFQDKYRQCNFREKVYSHFESGKNVNKPSKHRKRKAFADVEVRKLISHFTLCFLNYPQKYFHSYLQTPPFFHCCDFEMMKRSFAKLPKFLLHPNQS